MILTIFGLAFVLPTAIRAISSEQANDVGHPFRTRATTISQVRVSRHSQGPSSKPSSTNQVFKTSLGSKGNENVFQNTSGILRPDEVGFAEPDPAPLTAPPVTAQSSQTARAPPLIKSSTIAPSSGTSGAVIRTESASQKTELTKNRITPSLGAKSTDLPDLIVGSQTIKANDQNEYTLVHGQASPGAVATVSGTIVSIAPKASDNGAAHSIYVPNTNATTGSKSGPAETSVQAFKGGVPGAGEGLWSSSIAPLVGIAVLLWL